MKFRHNIHSASLWQKNEKIPKFLIFRAFSAIFESKKKNAVFCIFVQFTN